MVMHLLEQNNYTIGSTAHLHSSYNHTLVRHKHCSQIGMLSVSSTTVLYSTIKY